MDFHQTRMGDKFYNYDIPRFIEAINNLTEAINNLNQKLENKNTETKKEG